MQIFGETNEQTKDVHVSSPTSCRLLRGLQWRRRKCSIFIHCIISIGEFHQICVFLCRLVNSTSRVGLRSWTVCPMSARPCCSLLTVGKHFIFLFHIAGDFPEFIKHFFCYVTSYGDFLITTHKKICWLSVKVTVRKQRKAKTIYIW